MQFLIGNRWFPWWISKKKPPAEAKKTRIDYNEISIKNDAPQAKIFRDIQSGNAIFLTKTVQKCWKFPPPAESPPASSRWTPPNRTPPRIDSSPLGPPPRRGYYGFCIPDGVSQGFLIKKNPSDPRWSETRGGGLLKVPKSPNFFSPAALFLPYIVISVLILAFMDPARRRRKIWGFLHVF